MPLITKATGITDRTKTLIDHIYTNVLPKKTNKKQTKKKNNNKNNKTEAGICLADTERITYLFTVL